jgi:hypothetical protein
VRRQQEVEQGDAAAEKSGAPPMHPRIHRFDENLGAIGCEQGDDGLRP